MHNSSQEKQLRNLQQFFTISRCFQEMKSPTEGKVLLSGPEGMGPPEGKVLQSFHTSVTPPDIATNGALPMAKSRSEAPSLLGAKQGQD